MDPGKPGPFDDGRRRALAHFEALDDPSERAILTLRFYQGFSLAEIAEKLGLGREELRVRYRAALRKVEASMKAECDPPGRDETPAPDRQEDEPIETVAEVFWEELHRGDEADGTNYRMQYPDLGDDLRRRLALIRLMYKERPAHRSGPPFPLQPSLASTGFRRLVRKAQSGDRRAMDEVLAAMEPFLPKQSRPYEDPRLGNGCESMLGEARLRAWGQLGSFESGENDEETFAMFQSWIGQLVRRLGMNTRRDHARRRRNPGRGKTVIPNGSPLPGPTIDWDQGEGKTPPESLRPEAARIQDSLVRFRDREEAGVLWLHLFDGLTFREIAERIDLDYRRVREQYRRGIRRLEVELADLL